jgi:hypothetical protein
LKPANRFSLWLAPPILMHGYVLFVAWIIGSCLFALFFVCFSVFRWQSSWTTVTIPTQPNVD